MDLMDLAFTYGVPAYVILQFAGLVAARFEGWRLAFMLPLGLALPIAAWCLLALLQQSNLWPLPFILFAPFGAAYLAVVLILRALLPHRRGAPG